MTLAEFYDGVTRRMRKHPSWRYGQALFNYLDEVRPDLSKQVRASERDPYYATDRADPRLKAFHNFLFTEW